MKLESGAGNPPAALPALVLTGIQQGAYEGPAVERTKKLSVTPRRARRTACEEPLGRQDQHAVATQASGERLTVMRERGQGGPVGVAFPNEPVGVWPAGGGSQAGTFIGV